MKVKGYFSIGGGRQVALLEIAGDSDDAEAEMNNAGFRSAGSEELDGLYRTSSSALPNQLIVALGEKGELFGYSVVPCLSISTAGNGLRSMYAEFRRRSWLTDTLFAAIANREHS